MSSLAFLSLARVGHRKVPHVPNNTERLQAFRRYAPAQFANAYFSPPSPGPNQPQTAGRRLLSSKDQSA